MNNKDTLRENVREALTEYRDHLQKRVNDDHIDFEDAVTSLTQVQSAMRILWMDN